MTKGTIMESLLGVCIEILDQEQYVSMAVSMIKKRLSATTPVAQLASVFRF